ncbi:MAG TPA: DUF4390 domain-containing protein [Acidithiobacillus sp.]|nr:DUF4390 domain-containing protein [Acidithiobacillus sp.]
MSQDGALRLPISRNWQQQFVVILVGLYCFWGLAGIAVAGPAFHVEHLQVTPCGDAIKINASVQLGKEALLQQILDQGQTLVWVVEAEWREPEPFSFIPGVGVHAHREQHWRIHYYPLTNQYAIEDQHGALTLYAHWSAVATVLAQVHDFMLPLVHGAARGQVALRVYIDVQALPLPLRLRSLLGHWKLESPWIVSAPLSH